MRALVTGGNGFVGKLLHRRLADDGVGVFTMGRRESSSANGRHLALGDTPWTSAHWQTALDSTQPDVIFHLAGKVKGSADDVMAANYGLVATLLPVLRTYSTPPLLFVAGSAAEYGRAIVDGKETTETNPCSPAPGSYGLSKLRQTEAVLRYMEDTGARAIIARVFNAIGPGMPTSLALGDFASQIAAMGPAGGVMRTGNIDTSRDFISGALTASILARLARTSKASGIINVCSGQAFHLRPLIDRMIRKSGKSIKLEIDSSRLRPGEQMVVIGSNAKLASLGISVPLEDMGAIAESILDRAVASLSPA